MPANERRQIEHLARFWDDPARDDTTDDRGLDPAFATTVRRLQTLHQPPQIDPEFLDRLEAELLDPRPAATELATVRLATSPNGRMAPTTWSRLVLRSEHSHRALLVAQLATAALVLVTLVSTVLIFGRTYTSTAPAEPVVVPAVDVVDVAPERPLLDTVVNGIPDVHAVLALENWSLRPSETPLTLRALGGPRVAVVADGSVTATVAGAARDLGPGEHLVVPGDLDASLVNAGPDDASLAVVYLVPSYVQGGETRNSSNPVAQSRTLVDLFVAPTLISTSPDALPAGRARLVVQRLTAPPGGRMPEVSAQPQTWLAIASGTLGVTLDGQRLPFGWELGEERTIAAKQYLPEIAPGTRMMLRNAGQDSLVLYRLSVAPDPASSAESARTTPPGPSAMVLLGNWRLNDRPTVGASAFPHRRFVHAGFRGEAGPMLGPRLDRVDHATRARASPG